MLQPFLRRGFALGGVLCLLSAAGCVERRQVIITDPPGAIVYDERNQPIGATPVDRTFIFYGTYRYRLVKDGYETLIVDEKVNSPWYEVVPLDFISENLVPYVLRDVRSFTYKLTPGQVISPEVIQSRAEPLRRKGRAIGAPAEALPADPTAVEAPPGSLPPQIPAQTLPPQAPPLQPPPPGFVPQPVPAGP